MMKRSKGEEDLFIALLEYRNTPTKGLSLSPSQLLFNRRVRTKLPVSDKLLKPKIGEGIHDCLIAKSLSNKKYYDRTAKERAGFERGQKVFVQNNATKQWKPAIVLSKCDTPRSYIIKEENGSIVRRNSSFLRVDKRSNANLRREECLNLNLNLIP